MSSGTARSGPTAPAWMSAGLWQRLYFLPLPHQQSSFARNIVEVMSPPSVHPLLEVRPLGADGGVEAVAREDEQVGGQREQPAVDRLDDLLEIAARQRGVAGAAGEQGVAAEEDGVTLEQERRGPRGVTGVVDGAQAEVADRDDLVVGDHEVVGGQHRRVVGRNADVDPRVANRLDRLDV